MKEHISTSQPKWRRPSLSKTFRIRSDTIDTLAHEARKKRVTLNILVNNVLEKWCEWYRLVNGLSFSEWTFRELLASIDTELLKECGARAGRITPEQIRIMMKLRKEKSTVFGILRILARHAGPYTYDEIETEGKQVFTLRHTLGEKWSIWWKAYIEGMLKSFEIAGDRKEQVDHDEVTVRVTL